MTNGEAVTAPQKKRFPVGSVIILIFTILLFFFLVQLIMFSDFYDSYGRDITKENWISGVSLIMLLFIIILLLGGFPSKRAQPQTTFASQGQMMPVAPPIQGVEPGMAVVGTEMAAPPMNVVEAEPLVVEAEVVEAEPIEAEVEEIDEVLKTKKPRLIEYPKKVPGGVYGDTIIRVDPRTKFNLRTLLVRSCMICDRQGKCWDEIQDAIPRDQFLENIECKKGLRHLKGEGTEPRKKIKKVKMVVKPTE
jgi:hypothetical protein